MPELNRPDGRTQGPLPYAPLSGRNPAAFADKVVTTTSVPDASTGNTLEDHIIELLARSGHSAATQYADQTDYDPGDEVYWTDGDGVTHIYFRLTAGRDAAGSTPATLVGVWREVVNDLRNIPVDGNGDTTKSILVREAGHGGVRAEVSAWEKLQNSQNQTQVQALIDAGSITAAQARTLIQSYGYRTAAQVASAIAAAGHQTAAQVQSLIDAAIGDRSDIWRGIWGDLAADTQFRVGDIVEHTDFYYICKVAHTKQSGGPDTQPENWKVLNNWYGAWRARYFHEGVFVLDDGKVWVSAHDVNNSDPAPSAASNTKWIDLASTLVEPSDESDFKPSLTVGKDSQERAVLESPGPQGLWAAPSSYPRGLPANSGAIVDSVRTSALNTQRRLYIRSLSEDLNQFISLAANSGALSFKQRPVELEFRISGDFVAPMAGSQVALTVHYRPDSGGDVTVYTLHPTIPSSASPTNPFTFDDVVDFSQYDLGQYDSIHIEYSRRSGSVSEPNMLNALRNLRLHINVNGSVISPDAYDTGPVQSRPLRDIVSYDSAEETAVVYKGQIADWNHNEVVSPLRRPAGSATGAGWEIQESSRGAGGAGAGEREIKILTAGEYDIDFSGSLSFHDRTTGQDEADDVVTEMLHIPSAHAGDKSRFPSNSDMTVLGSKRLYDIAEIDGDVPLALQGTGTWRHLVPTIPSVLDDGSNHRYVRYWNTVTRDRFGRMQRPQIRVTPGNYRYQITAEVVLVGDPGSGSIFATRNAHGKVVYLWLDHSGTQQTPYTHTWRFLDTAGGQERGSDGTGGQDPTDIMEFWLGLTQPSNQSFDWTAVRSVTLKYKVWAADDNHATFHLSAAAQTFAANDVVAFRARNDSAYSGSRLLHASGVNLTIGNDADITGRRFTAAGPLSGTKVNLGDVSTDWFHVEDGELVARRDMRSVSLAVSYASTQFPHVEIWRYLSGYASKELVTRQIAVGTPRQANAEAHGVVAGERFEFIVNRGSLTGNVTVNAEAKTPDSVPAKQVRLEGIHRPRRLIDTNTRLSHTAWQRIPLLNGFRWSSFPVIRLYYKTSAGHWAAVAPIDSFLFEDIGTNSSTGGSSILGRGLQNGDKRVFLVAANSDSRTQGLYIAALHDGGLAVLAAESTPVITGLKGWGE